MPIFRQKSLLFVHIPKNAGRSIEAALLQGEGSHVGERRNLISRIGKALTGTAASPFAEEYLIGTIDRSFAAQHLTWAEMDWLGLLDEPAIRALTPFAVVRNPFDRAVSSVHHFTPGHDVGAGDAAGFERLLEAWLDRPLTNHNDRAHRRPQHDYVIDRHGRQVAGKILRFENLGEDFANLMEETGQPDLTLGWHGRSDRLQNYRDYFTPHARKLVEREFGVDLESFGYSF